MIHLTIHHIGYLVKKINQAIDEFERLGYTAVSDTIYDLLSDESAHNDGVHCIVGQLEQVAKNQWDGVGDQVPGDAALCHIFYHMFCSPECNILILS